MQRKTSIIILIVGCLSLFISFVTTLPSGEKLVFLGVILITAGIVGFFKGASVQAIPFTGKKTSIGYLVHNWKFIIGAIVCMILFNPFSTPEPRTRLTENTTSTKQYAKKDGTFDERKDDLVELCKDFVYYKAKTYKYGREGNVQEQNEAQVAFERVNRWLSDYEESDVTKVCSQYDTQENLAAYMQ